MNNSVLDLSIQNLMLAYIFILFLILIFQWRGIKRQKQIVIASLRMTLQLAVMGYILMYVFDHPSWWLRILVVACMMAVAVFNAIKRVKGIISKELKGILCISMVAGFALTALIFVGAVLCTDPWFDPQYFIPISSMFIGNCMTGMALAANSMISSFRDKRGLIENALMLGASCRRAAHEIVNDAFDSAILPTMNSMMTMGLVTLPGMMTGQLMSGVFPLTAIKYQIAIILGILGCTSFSVVLFVLLGYRTFFTETEALKEIEHK